jgi:hypothetical protein
VADGEASIVISAVDGCVQAAAHTIVASMARRAM